MQSIVDKIIKPDKCLLAIALPLTEVDFYNDLKGNAQKDYAKSRKRKLHFNDRALWEIDHMPIVNLIQSISKELKSYGLTVLNNFKFPDLALLAQYEVVTIVAHFLKKDKKVEFYDGLFSNSDVEHQIPTDFMGIIDLTICHSVELQNEIKFSGRKCIVIANEHAADLELRLILYYNLIKLLTKKDKSYIDAYSEIRITLSKLNK